MENTRPIVVPARHVLADADQALAHAAMERHADLGALEVQPRLLQIGLRRAQVGLGPGDLGQVEGERSGFLVFRPSRHSSCLIWAVASSRSRAVCASATRASA